MESTGGPPTVDSDSFSEFAFSFTQTAAGPCSRRAVSPPP